MDKTIVHGLPTSIFHNIVDHAGHKEPPQLLLIDSTFLLKILIPALLLSAPKLLLTVKQVVHAMVVTQLVSINMPLKMESHIQVVNNMLPETWFSVENANQLICAKIAVVPLQHSEMKVKKIAEQFHSSLTTLAAITL